jgi:hypothetical protein
LPVDRYHRETLRAQVFGAVANRKTAKWEKIAAVSGSSLQKLSTHNFSGTQCVKKDSHVRISESQNTPRATNLISPLAGLNFHRENCSSLALGFPSI